jgi:hypothetical protein
MTSKPDETNESAEVKKPYETPRLHVYGDIREIARSAGRMGMADGGAHQMNKTR